MDELYWKAYEAEYRSAILAGYGEQATAQAAFKANIGLMVQSEMECKAIYEEHQRKMQAEYEAMPWRFTPGWGVE